MPITGLDEELPVHRENPTGEVAGCGSRNASVGTPPPAGSRRPSRQRNLLPTIEDVGPDLCR
jgi:hypothetical protein